MWVKNVPKSPETLLAQQLVAISEVIEFVKPVLADMGVQLRTHATDINRIERKLNRTIEALQLTKMNEDIGPAKPASEELLNPAGRGAGEPEFD